MGKRFNRVNAKTRNQLLLMRAFNQVKKGLSKWLM